MSNTNGHLEDHGDDSSREMKTVSFMLHEERDEESWSDEAELSLPRIAATTMDY